MLSKCFKSCFTILYAPQQMSNSSKIINQEAFLVRFEKLLITLTVCRDFRGIFLPQAFPIPANTLYHVFWIMSKVYSLYLESFLSIPGLLTSVRRWITQGKKSDEHSPWEKLTGIDKVNFEEKNYSAKTSEGSFKKILQN